MEVVVEGAQFEALDKKRNKPCLDKGRTTLFSYFESDLRQYKYSEYKYKKRCVWEQMGTKIPLSDIGSNLHHLIRPALPGEPLVVQRLLTSERLSVQQTQQKIGLLWKFDIWSSYLVGADVDWFPMLVRLDPFS